MDDLKFKELKVFIANRIKIDLKDNLEEKAASLSTLYFNCVDIYSDEFRLYKDSKTNSEKTYGELYKYYTTQFNKTLKTKGEIEAYIWSDERYFNHMYKLNQQESVVTFLEETISIIKQLGFTIKNIIEIKKQRMGD